MGDVRLATLNKAFVEIPQLEGESSRRSLRSRGARFSRPHDLLFYVFRPKATAVSAPA